MESANFTPIYRCGFMNVIRKNYLTDWCSFIIENTNLKSNFIGSGNRISSKVGVQNTF